jgi:ACS family hexuronate transporter-like MFS transporter
LSGRGFTGTKIGNVRWTICAMLFAATTINYMDRRFWASQAHPHAERCQSWHRPDRREFSDRRSILYLFSMRSASLARALRRQVGTRIGYMVIMAVWSLSAMGHALVNSVLQLGIARSCLGIGESGNFPAANKTNAEWFPQKSARSLSASSTAAPMSA